MDCLRDGCALWFLQGGYMNMCRPGGVRVVVRKLVSWLVVEKLSWRKNGKWRVEWWRGVERT